MTNEECFLLAMAIYQNEGKAANELSNGVIELYLVDAGFEPTPENIQRIKIA